jgi:small GTP-binding protein
MGESKVGKTSIINRHHNKSFDPDPIATVGVSHIKETFSYRGREIERQIFDTAGQDIYASIPITYYRNADGAIAVFDVDNEESFPGVLDCLGFVARNWMQKENPPIVVAANKKDLRPSIEQEEAGREWMAWAQSEGVKLVFTSAKDGTNIEEIFALVSTLAIQARDGVPETTVAPVALVPESPPIRKTGSTAKLRPHHKQKCCG